MNIHTNIALAGKHGRPILTDVFWVSDQHPKPVIIFVHGFKGFKDWGHFNLLARNFAAAGFVLIKFNFSHNGTTPQSPSDFEDLEAFGNNNFSIELDDLGVVIDALTDGCLPVPSREVDVEQIGLIGHSRGGGIVLLKAGEDDRVKKVATWASVSEFGKFWSGNAMQKWQDDGVMYVENARTKQQMPLYWQLYENYFANLNRLHIPSVVKKMTIPLLIVHGTADTAVPYTTATFLHELCPHSQLLCIENGDHTFGGKHPYPADEALPTDAERVYQETVRFFVQKM